MLHLAGPKWEPTAAYYDCRFAVLRQPLGFERGAEVLNDDTEAIHAYIEIDQEIVAVGRSHLIPRTSNGSQSDFPGQSGPKTPPFSSLNASNRPAIQIRQMGTSMHIEEKVSQLLSSKHLRRHPFNNLVQHAVSYKHVKLPYRFINPKAGESSMSRIQYRTLALIVP